MERPHRRAHAQPRLACRDLVRARSSAIVSSSISSTCARRQRRLDFTRKLASVLTFDPGTKALRFGNDGHRTGRAGGAVGEPQYILLSFPAVPSHDPSLKR